MDRETNQLHFELAELQEDKSCKVNNEGGEGEASKDQLIEAEEVADNEKQGK